jgi:hypothetical protein
LGWLFPLSDIQLDFDSFVSFVVLRLARSILLRQYYYYYYFLIEHQDIRQCHFPGDQNRAEDRYEEEAYNPNEEGQHVFQSLSPD